jgi:large subunit ribosomal protein L28
MPRVCFFSGARTSVGNKVRYRGKAKYLGGIGKKITACTRRQVRPNLQTVTAVIDGRPRRIKVSTRILRQGQIAKPLRRKYTYTRKQRAASA